MHRSTPIRAVLASVVGMVCGMLVLAPAFAGGVSDQEKTVQQVVAEIDRMHQKVDQYNEDIVVALDQKAQLDAQIVISQQSIAAQQAVLDQLAVQLGNVAVSKVMGTGSGALGPLFTDPVALDESLQRDHLAKVAVDAGGATTNDYEVLLDQMQAEQKSLEENQAQAAALAEQAETSREKAEQALEDLEARESKERNKLGVLIDQEQQRQAEQAAAEYAAQVKAAQAKAAADKAAQANSSNNSGSGNSGSSTSGAGTASGSSNSGSNTPSSSGSAGSSGSGSSNASSGGSGSDAGSSGGSDSGISSQPVSSRAGTAVNAAAGQQGVPYRFATSNPGVSFDCSGLTAYAWSVAGVNLPHQSGQQYASTPHVSKESAQPGDLIFYYSPISHVGIYIGGGQMIHAPATGKVVSVTTVRWDKVVGVSRPG